MDVENYDKDLFVGDRRYNDYTSMMAALVILKLIAEIIVECPTCKGRPKGHPISVTKGGTELDGKFYQVDPKFVVGHDKLKSFDCKHKVGQYHNLEPMFQLEVTHADMSHVVSVEFTECAYWAINYSNWQDKGMKESCCALGDLTNVLGEMTT